MIYLCPIIIFANTPIIIVIILISIITIILIRNKKKENIHLAMIYLCATIICIITLFVEQNKSHCCKVIAMCTMWIVTITFTTTIF